MKPLRIVLFSLAGICCLAGFAYLGYWYKSTHGSGSAKTMIASASKPTPAWFLKMEEKATAAKKFITRKNYNKNICFLIDMDLPSGTNRFFIYDLVKDSITDAALVAHGSCNEAWLQGRKYSNEVGSGCTSPGRYKVGNPYNGRFGRAYKLHGLDSSNSNAYARFVVLHSYECVPDNEVDPYPICQSAGCPMVSVSFMKKLEGIIDKSSKPILLWIYE